MNVHVLESADAAVSTDARSVFDTIVRDIRVATDGVPALRREGDSLVLLCAHAFSERDDEPQRERAWRIFVRALARVAMATQSAPLLEIVAENADLL
jgi:hypothetical protein